MPPNTAPESFSPSPLAPDFAGRDRVLLYTRGMNLAPSRGVALALRSMRRAGEFAPAAKVMEALFRTLQENNVPFITTLDGVTPIVSTPPMNRRIVIAEDMEQHSLTKVLKNRLLPLVGKKREGGNKP